MVLSHRRELIKANLIAILGTIVAVPIPLLIPLLVDEVLLDQPATAVRTINALFPESWHHPVLYILAILFLTLLMRLLALVFAVLQTRQFTLVSKDVTFRIRRALLRRLERVSMSEYETLGSGTVASHLVTDIDAVDNFLGIVTSKFLVALLSILGTAMVLLWMHWQLALFILLLNPLVIYVTTVFGRKVKELKRHENSAYQLFQESLSETLDAIQQIRSSNREGHYIHRIVGKADNIRRHSASFTWKSDAAARLSFAIFLFGFDIFRAGSMLMVLYSDLSIGQMLAVFAYLWFMMGPVQEVLAIQYAYNGARAALERINGLMEIRLEPEYPHLRDPFAGEPTADLRLEKIRFRYGDGPLVLNDVSLHIRAGEKIALVGASGGGKTTLVQVILGLYTPESGTIRFNGVPVSEIGMDVVRDNVATVLQHPALFNDTVRINLTLGRELPDEALWQALRIAQLDDVVEQLDQGLDTLIGRGGIRLSGGQRQRLAVARMVLSDPRVVILDEATSALDTTTESRLHSALQAFLRGRTTLIIAHRLSAVKQADRALVFDDGRIIEEGSHAELIESNGLYASLYGKHQEA
ncbi:MAG: ABC transporter ATP-binding protein [Candidatus Sedimenticola endophacoides]|uniref:ABC transporter ATP-binding protein n=1 Tax=Candidatus Sedimenticola endophacoides TaxID=2548426 RepID=A0A6N4DTU9_9GAMM|nr:MAG: ABC transporter ATP-binding protein [Candidatus Sedimenticola endophacoides]OQX34879.1 MAG: ABC transporter ATP-binding protein [Candidatus Sedimenticola endophacoides]OQX40263.1 MAG: ABC transporter ATP-binding protein [Candidatus Sedimenticola endophacoides]PUD98557.1 MAG: ABC transporter ATP-binding protein [Candidatus Sedimenticola endophacoides]PUE00298.1 MAG: ABC transporter ATP-binding protein [Candidatus Sedimenticola endophacoides]